MSKGLSKKKSKINQEQDAIKNIKLKNKVMNSEKIKNKDLEQKNNSKTVKNPNITNQKKEEINHVNIILAKGKKSHNDKQDTDKKAIKNQQEGKKESSIHQEYITEKANLNNLGERNTLLKASPVYKPFTYPWAYDAWLTQQRIHWLPDEVPMSDDIKDWKNNISDAEKNLLTHIFRFFTQADIEVNNCYMKNYTRVFQPTEIQMMLAAFSNTETIHIAAYSHLLDTVGMPEIEYSAFIQYKEMSDKYNYMQQFNVDSKAGIALTLAVFGAFTEGVQLFASFAILLNFPRFGKMKGMGQIITWSVRDETLHTHSIIKLFRHFVQENPEIHTEELINAIYEACFTIIRHEDAFIDLAFEMGQIEGLTAFEVKKYIRYIADKRLQQLGYNPVFLINDNPIPWLDEILNGIEHANFFETRVTEYTKAATKGNWDEAFEEMLGD